MGSRKIKFCAYPGCEKYWDAKGDRGCGNKKWCEEHRLEIQRKGGREYYHKNKERCLMTSAKWRKENPEKRRAAQKSWYQNNKEKAAEYQRNYYLAHRKERINKYSTTKEYIIEKNMRYYKENRELILAKRRERYWRSKHLNKG